MNRFLLAMMLLTATGSLVARAQPPQPLGPDGGGAVLKVPGSDFSTAPKPPLPYPSGISQPPQGSSVMNAWNNQAVADRPTLPQDQSGGSILAKLAPQQGPDPNQNILVHAGHGPWMILITSYTGPESPKMAREMVNELNAGYGLKSYVYNYGAEDRRKEYDRVKDLIEKQKQFFREQNLPVEHPVRVRYIRVEEQCGVLVGGYAHETAARRALDDLRKLKPPDPKKAPLHMNLFERRDPAHPDRVETERVYLNPFREAFVVRNPATKIDRPDTFDQPDLAVLRKMNEGVPYSLLQCKKPVTLAIKQFQTPTIVQSRSATGSIMENLNFSKSKTPQQADQAAANAYIMTCLLREKSMPAYVLHTKFSSIVCVGEFDSEDDPNLRAMQSHLSPTNLQDIIGPKLKLDDLRMFPTPMPMRVPQMAGR